MKGISGMFVGAFSSLSSSLSCCACVDDRPRQYVSEKESFVVLKNQPSSVPPPSVEQAWQNRGHELPMERTSRRRRGSGRSSFSVRRGLLSKPTSSRRPQISAPSNFRHIYSESFRFPDYGLPRARPRPLSFRPLELSIYQHDNHLSPILSPVDYPSPPVTPPQRVVTHSPHSDGSYTVAHARSYSSSLSFHIPRKATNTGSVFDSPRSGSDTITQPSPARKRAQSIKANESAMDDLIEKVATAMLERDRIQKQLDDVIERQSIYVSSRPSTANEMRPSTTRSIVDMEPMPEIPALPPNAPSFSERVTSDRPRTAPPKGSVYIPYREKPLSEESPAFASAFALSSSSRCIEGRPPPPPLPLRLRPPLRKKKSFSHVSNWLGFSGYQQPARDISLDSITNKPKPIQPNDGFYQIATPSQPDEPARRLSFESEESVSDWSSSEDLEQQTVPTSWSPSSSTTVRAADPPRAVMFGQAPRRESVGVAF
ncbi:uncharacterized protein BCR38DRAFT_410170 [Pseudomassariella vexata]|uniref:Uncharacterized protein n=1 Tax=Pseudomassariella vexata TaxID=1141098 RepID=A0A1Y2DVA4_9PEZI|nr:uncharacterized protein BCR38DRAFT_410170 [Pseudomassariella vexata]ORY63222.1 hypothetical protein BCR38DRAFT_410170 [Pseudomassariella vexata]